MKEKMNEDMNAEEVSDDITSEVLSGSSVENSAEDSVGNSNESVYDESLGEEKPKRNFNFDILYKIGMVLSVICAVVCLVVYVQCLRTLKAEGALDAGLWEFLKKATKGIYYNSIFFRISFICAAVIFLFAKIMMIVNAFKEGNIADVISFRAKQIFIVCAYILIALPLNIKPISNFIESKTLIEIIYVIGMLILFLGVFPRLWIKQESKAWNINDDEGSRRLLVVAAISVIFGLVLPFILMVVLICVGIVVAYFVCNALASESSGASSSGVGNQESRESKSDTKARNGGSGLIGPDGTDLKELQRNSGAFEKGKDDHYIYVKRSCDVYIDKDLIGVDSVYVEGNLYHKVCDLVQAQKGYYHICSMETGKEINVNTLRRGRKL